MSEEVQNPISSLLESAVAMHELFSTLVEAGFSERQVLIMIAEVLRTPQSE